jgi:hypothetical protein
MRHGHRGNTSVVNLFGGSYEDYDRRTRADPPSLHISSKKRSRLGSIHMIASAADPSDREVPSRPRDPALSNSRAPWSIATILHSHIDVRGPLGITGSRQVRTRVNAAVEDVSSSPRSGTR